MMALRAVCLAVKGMALILLYGCSKAGSGGKAAVSCHVSHHGRSIAGATVYVKYDAREFAGTGVYDLKMVTGTGAESGRAQADGLRPGNYFFYAEGYDSSIGEAVRGGVPLEVKWKQRKDNLLLEIPVTE